MINWRKYFIITLLKLSWQKSYDYFKLIKKIEKLSISEKKEIQNNKLKKILLHSYKNVPYYKKVLEESWVVNKDLEVNLNNFSKIPILNKEILRNEFKNLQDFSKHNRKTFENTSWWSTWEPVKFIQDNVLWDWKVATKFYFASFMNKILWEKELRLWWSERDLLVWKDSLSKRLKDLLYNRVECNSFKMSENDMKNYIKKINSFKPKTIEAYVQSIYELAKFAKDNNLEVYSPKWWILTSAGTLYPDMEKLIKDVFKSKVINRYWSREVWDIACSRDWNENLEINILQNYVEILDDDLNPVKPWETWKIYITTLNNFSMPLIRYEIWDIWVQSDKEFEIKKVSGRNVNIFTNINWSKIDWEFFTHLFYMKSWLKSFQVIQEKKDLIRIKVVLLNKENFQKDKISIEKDILKVMWKCYIKWEEVKSIEPSKSWKFLYTISKVK